MILRACAAEEKLYEAESARPPDPESIAKPMGGENSKKKVVWHFLLHIISPLQRTLAESLKILIWKPQESVLQNTHLRRHS